MPPAEHVRSGDRPWPFVPPGAPGAASSPGLARWWSRARLEAAIRRLDLGRWQRFLDELEAEAGARPRLAEVTRVGPSGAAVIGLLIDVADAGRRLHSYSIRGARRSLAAPRVLALASLIAQRLPAHRILRARLDDQGGFHYWALVEPSGPRGSTALDSPALLLRRTSAFAALVESALLLTAESAPANDPPSPAECDSDGPPPSPYAVWFYTPVTSSGSVGPGLATLNTVGAGAPPLLGGNPTVVNVSA